MGIRVPDKIIVNEKMNITSDAISHTDIIQPIIQVNAAQNQIEMPQKMKLKELEVQNSGIKSFGRGKFKGEDIEIEDANRGLILTANNSSKWIIWVDNAGSLFTTQIAASAEIPFAERVTKIGSQVTKFQQLKTEWLTLNPDDLKGRLNFIEKILKVLLK